MKALRAVKALARIDAKSILRDALLRWMLGLPIVLSLVMRWMVPAIQRWALARYEFDLTPYYPLILSYFFILLTPLLFGAVIGFLLLDERDDRTLTALQVTPLTAKGYLAYRIAIPVVLSVILSLLAVPLTGLILPPFVGLFLAVLMAAMEAPIFALFLGAFAENKVAGFAMMKGMSIVVLLPVIGWFLPYPWQLLVGVIPTYWPVKACWQAIKGEFYLHWWVLGVVYHAIVVSLLLRRFDRALRR